MPAAGGTFICRSSLCLFFVRVCPAPLRFLAPRLPSCLLPFLAHVVDFVVMQLHFCVVPPCFGASVLGSWGVLLVPRPPMVPPLCGPPCSTTVQYPCTPSFAFFHAAMSSGLLVCNCMGLYSHHAMSIGLYALMEQGIHHIQAPESAPCPSLLRLLLRCVGRCVNSIICAQDTCQACGNK